MAPLTVVNVLLALLPRVVIAVMQTTIIRASMTAYSTAVGPSSRFTKSTTKLVSFFIGLLPCKYVVDTVSAFPHAGGCLTQPTLHTGDRGRELLGGLGLGFRGA